MTPWYVACQAPPTTGFSTVKNLLANARDVGSIPELERSPGGGNGNPLQYSCLENSMEGREHGPVEEWKNPAEVCPEHMNEEANGATGCMERWAKGRSSRTQ